ncbi:MAG: hypothetical protein MUE81_13375 [Thermoflexibacter sp.]|jgi:hypothetical protein|nr:hypothetical protein [Thermoflexibacter sp.]
MTQNNVFSKIFIFSLILFIFSCRPTDVIEIGYELEIFVGDAVDFGIEDVTVTLFTNVEDFQKNTNPVKTAQTDSRGYVLFKGLDRSVFTYFVSAEKGELNNWGDKTQLIFSKFDQQSQSFKLQIKASLANDIAGRYEKRWRQVSKFIGNSPDNTCNARQIHAFRRDWFIKMFNGSTCPNPGTEVNGDVWAVTSDNKGIIRGTPGGISQRRLNILELNSRRLVYSETPSLGFTITETFEAVD